MLPPGPIPDDLRSAAPEGRSSWPHLRTRRRSVEIGQQLLTRDEVYQLNRDALPDSVQRAQGTPGSPHAHVHRHHRRRRGIQLLDCQRPGGGAGGARAGGLPARHPAAGHQDGGVLLHLAVLRRRVPSAAWSFSPSSAPCSRGWCTWVTSLLAIGTGGDPTRRIKISGKDQIAYIGAAINGMLDAQAQGHRGASRQRAAKRGVPGRRAGRDLPRDAGRDDPGRALPAAASPPGSLQRPGGQGRRDDPPPVLLPLP